MTTTNRLIWLKGTTSVVEKIFRLSRPEVSQMSKYANGSIINATLSFFNFIISNVINFNHIM
jgi:hypothetical protein